MKNTDKGRDDLVQQIEEMESKQKRAYLRLFERVGQEIGSRFHTTLAEQEAKMEQEQDNFQQLSADKMEMDRLKA